MEIKEFALSANLTFWTGDTKGVKNDKHQGEKSDKIWSSCVFIS